MYLPSFFCHVFENNYIVQSKRELDVWKNIHAAGWVRIHVSTP